MDPEQLWETTLNPENRVMIQVTMEDAQRADEILQSLWVIKSSRAENLLKKCKICKQSRYLRGVPVNELKEKEEISAKPEETNQENSESEPILEEEIAKPNAAAIHAGVTGEQYDMEPATPEQDADVFEGEDAIRIAYSFTGEEIKEGLQVFQRETMFKRI